MDKHTSGCRVGVSLDPWSVSQVIALHEPVCHRYRVELSSTQIATLRVTYMRRTSQSTTYFRIRSALMSNPEELVYERAVLGCRRETCAYY